MTNETKANEAANKATDNKNAGVEGTNIVEEARRVRDEIRAENDRRESILAQEQKLQAERMLAGSAGGRVEPTPVREETAKEYADRVMKNNVRPVKND